MATARRIGTGQAASRAAILDATQELMVADGYAAVSARRVAAAAEVTPALVQYYFPTMDDLLLAVYRRAADEMEQRQARALASPRPLRAYWELSIDSARAAIAIEFMALANHRKAIRAEIARYAERARDTLAEFLGRVPIAGDGRNSPAGAALLMAGIARALVMEGGLGISAGHREARAMVEAWLDAIEPRPDDGR